MPPRIKHNRYTEATDLASFVTSKTETPLVSDISVDRLIGDGLTTLHREMKNILVMSSKGKLDASAAKDLRDHLKLLFELKDREKGLLGNITDEQLEALRLKSLSEEPKKEEST